MLRLKGTFADGRPFVLLGIDEENIKRLTADKPMHIKTEPLGADHDIVIVYGKTLQDVIDELVKAGMQLTPPNEKP